MVRRDSTVSAAIAGVGDLGMEQEELGYGDGPTGALAAVEGPDSLSAHGEPSVRDVSPQTTYNRHRYQPADAPSETAGHVLGTESIPTRTTDTSSFATWSRRYTARLVAMDGLIAMLAVISTAVFFPHIISFSTPKLAVLIIGAGVAWPIAVAISRGYERSKIGVGGDEMRAVFRAVVLAIAAGAVPSAVTERPGVVALCVIGSPIAGAGSLLVRFAARRHLHHRQRDGHNVRKVIVVGSAYAAADLSAVLRRESQSGMQVIGVCVPQADVSRAHDAGLDVIGDLDQVPDLIKLYGADAVAVTGSDATRHNYLRELSWALEGAGVELLVHPGLIEVAGPRMHIRPYVGLPLLHVEQPHFTGWRRFIKRATDITLAGLGWW